jgi:hypothetical protein
MLFLSDFSRLIANSSAIGPPARVRPSCSTVAPRNSHCRSGALISSRSRRRAPARSCARWRRSWRTQIWHARWPRRPRISWKCSSSTCKNQRHARRAVQATRTVHCALPVAFNLPRRRLSRRRRRRAVLARRIPRRASMPTAAAFTSAISRAR